MRRSLSFLCATLAVAGTAFASSHREAPFITTVPKVDNTDVYAFMSYEQGRSDFVTLISNFLPLQDPGGGPNYFKLDPNALYEIHVDNNGDSKEDLTFQFRFKNNFKNVALPIGTGANQKMVSIPLTQAGQVTGANSGVNSAVLNVNEQYTLDIVRGDRRTGARASVTNASGGSTVFDKPVDNIGVKTIPDYAAYAAKHIFNVNIPGCSVPGKVFVGQRKEGFVVNLGTIFDLVNAPVEFITDPSKINAVPNEIDGKNITTLALEVHKSCLTAGNEPVIGVWSTASLRQARLLNGATPSGYQVSEKVGGPWVQVSRLGNPLVNEVVIGLTDKDKFNGAKPSGDGQFINYVTNPTLPALIEIALNKPGIAPTNIPRNDLVVTYLTGITGLNKPANVVPSEELRLNTSIAPVPYAQQDRLGVVGAILNNNPERAGFPNGRRPKDDIVDISLVAVMGGLCVANGDNNALGFGADCKPAAVPLGSTAFKLHDGADQAAAPFQTVFPYLSNPTPGSK